MFNNVKSLIIINVLFSLTTVSYSQPGYQNRALTISTAQSINFGAFSITGITGGTVTVGWDGSRTATGSIVLLAMAPNPQPAIFEIKLCQGKSINLTFPSTAVLTCNNGESLTIDIGPSEKGSNGAFITGTKDCNFVNSLRVGGTLHIKGKALSGTYTGGFYIALNQE